MSDLILGFSLESKLENLDRILNVLGAFHCCANSHGTYTHEAVAEMLTKFEIGYVDILKARATVESIRGRLLQKSNTGVAA